MCDQHEGHDHGHHRHGLGKNAELYFSLISGACLLAGFLFEPLTENELPISWGLYLAAYAFGGYFILKEAIAKTIKGQFEIDFLMVVAAIGAGFLGKWIEGALLLFLFSLGHALEHYATAKAKSSIAALSGLVPTTAWLRKNGQTIEVPLSSLQVGDLIQVRPHNSIAADGYVEQGMGSVDQSPITGESIPADKKPFVQPVDSQDDLKAVPRDSQVYAGTINGNALLEVRVTKIAADSTLSRMVTMISEAQKHKSATQLLTDRIQRFYVPAVLILVVLLNFGFLLLDETWGDSFYRSMAVLVAASPCALAISTPSAVLSGIARAARGGVLIKGGRPLEDLGGISALAFDKTGTLTEGRPKLTDVVAIAEGYGEHDVLKIAIAVERLSDHPLAKAIVRDGMQQLNGTEIPEAGKLIAVQGRGVQAKLAGDVALIGNLSFFVERDQKIPLQIVERIEAMESAGKTTMLVKLGDFYIGILGLMDTPREEAKQILEQLQHLGIHKMIMLTGDNQQVADSVAKILGLTEARGSLLPEEKVAVVKELMDQEHRLAMIGDGVNDAPAMAQSTVGIALGATGNDVALETADVALMSDTLANLPFAIGLSRRAKAIIRQNLWVSLGMVALLVPATLFDWANIGIAVLFHEGSTLLVVVNSLRLLSYKP
ncbi:MAG: heavy metal translocating P-type ATPase [Flavobacteriaceae bacterium]